MSIPTIAVPRRSELHTLLPSPKETRVRVDAFSKIMARLFPRSGSYGSPAFVRFLMFPASSRRPTRSSFTSSIETRSRLAPMDLRPIQGSVQNPCASNDRGRRHQIRSLESGSVEPSPSRAAERRRLREEVAIRKRKTSLLAGTLGLALVFAGGIGVIVSPQSALALIVAMGAGIVLLLVAFLLLRGPMTALSRKAPK